MPIWKISLLFLLTAVCEILGCYLPWLWLRGGKSAWLLLPAAACLTLFVWLLSLHPTATGRVYAAYAGVYLVVALAWLWLVDGITPRPSDWLGAGLALSGMVVVMAGRS